MDAAATLTEARAKRLMQEALRLKARRVRMEAARQREVLAAKERNRAERSKANSTTVWSPRKQWSVWDELKALEDKGRATKRIAGAYIAGDLSELHKTIMLCPMCKHGFDWKKHRYYNVFHYDHIYASGRCDVCRAMSTKLSLYLHETHVGQSWTPRAQLRQQRRKAITVG